MNQKILIIVGIVFALVFVLVMAIMMNTITNEANNANDQLTNVLGMTGEVNSGTFANGNIVTGDQLINAINNRTIIDTDIDVAIEVKTSANGAVTGATTFATSSDKYTAPDASSPDYINPEAKFLITANGPDYVKNGVVIKILAAQQ